MYVCMYVVSFGVDFISVLFVTTSCWGEDSSTAFGGSFFLFSKISLIFVIKFPVTVFTVLRIGSGTKLITRPAYLLIAFFAESTCFLKYDIMFSIFI